MSHNEPGGAKRLGKKTLDESNTEVMAALKIVRDAHPDLNDVMDYMKSRARLPEHLRPLWDARAVLAKYDTHEVNQLRSRVYPDDLRRQGSRTLDGARHTWKCCADGNKYLLQWRVNAGPPTAFRLNAIETYHPRDDEPERAAASKKTLSHRDPAGATGVAIKAAAIWEAKSKTQAFRDLTITSLPALGAALIKLRDASVAYRAVLDPFRRVGGWSGRSNEAKRLRGKVESAQLARDHAFDDLLAIIDPDSADE